MTFKKYFLLKKGVYIDPLIVDNNFMKKNAQSFQDVTCW